MTLITKNEFNSILIPIYWTRFQIFVKCKRYSADLQQFLTICEMFIRMEFKCNTLFLYKNIFHQNNETQIAEKLGII